MDIGLRYTVREEIKHWSACMPLPIKRSVSIESPRDILEIVVKRLEFDIDVVSSKTRVTMCVFARQLAQALAHAHSSNNQHLWTLTRIGDEIGGKHPASVAYAIRQTCDIYTTKHEYGGFRCWEVAADCFNKINLNIGDYVHEQANRN